MVKGFVKINSTLFECDITYSRSQPYFHSNESDKEIIKLDNIKNTDKIGDENIETPRTCSK